MARLEELQPGTVIRGILPDVLVSVESIKWFGSEAIELAYKDPDGRLLNELLYRKDESRIEIAEEGRPWSFDGDGALFRLVSEAYRIRLAHLFDPVLAVHTSLVTPLPHQITAVYEEMLPRHPLRFLLADDPGAGKTIMAGLLMKELVVRGDLNRCMIVCPGNLAEQWQDEMDGKFHLPFEILTNVGIESARTGNWFLENNFVIARLDKLARDENVQAKLSSPECNWDLIVFDEAHKLSASFFGNRIHQTQRYKLAKLLSPKTRNLLLMTATPHNGKEEDFQLFMAILDSDRFEGRFRDGVHTADVSDLMRRMVKENLLKFDGTRLFPERIAYTVPYKLSEAEAELYRQVTSYVRDEFNRADKLNNEKRAGNVGFALTILQRRLASSPEAIYQSLRRRREKLEKKRSELETRQHFQPLGNLDEAFTPPVSIDFDDLDEAPDGEVEDVEDEVLDQATAARTIEELEEEIKTLERLEALAYSVRSSREDRKWRELAGLLGEIFTHEAIADETAQNPPPYHAGRIPRPEPSLRQKLVIFTEHRDTLFYLQQRIGGYLGRPDSIVTIHGAMKREDRLKAQEAFKFDPQVQILLATDAAGEGINLQRAHLMVNYDLPWNPNRIEQRFGRIHRIGQTEVCHLWNLVAEETREGDVYRTLLDKIEEARQSLGGQVFDVLGKLQFEGKPLKDLLIEAIRYGEKPEVRARLTEVVSHAVDLDHFAKVIDESALTHEVMDIPAIQRVREEMERAEARRLQPHYIESFFLEGFAGLGGSIKPRESGRYEITHVPAQVRNSIRQAGSRKTVLQRYERVAFEKEYLEEQGKADAAFLCPGHPLLDAVLDLTLQRNRDLLRRGTVLVDDRDPGDQPRVLFYLEHSIQDASTSQTGRRHTVSRQMMYAELDRRQNVRLLHYAPYLDYRPLREDEPSPGAIIERPECAWITKDLEQAAVSHAINRLVPEHLEEVRSFRVGLIDKTRQAVKDRLTKERNYWDRRAEELKLKEREGKPITELNWQEARRRADDLYDRLKRRMDQLDLEARISALPPVILGGMVIVPAGLLARIAGKPELRAEGPVETQESAARARAIVMAVERGLGNEPIDREDEKVGYDIESRVPGTGRLRFIEVKGRVAGARTITVTKNEILYSLNKPEDFILAIVEFLDENDHRVHYVRRPFRREPDFGVTSVNYDFSGLLRRAEVPQ